MKKLALPIVIVFILGAGGLYMLRMNQSPSESPVNGTETKQGVFSSIRDAMSKSLSLKCEYLAGSDKTVAYVKGTSVRIDGVLGGKTQSGALIKEDTLWTWDIVKKEGLIMPLQYEKDETPMSESIIQNLEEQKQFCKVAVVSDDMFNPPEDVAFQDMSQLMNSMQIPSGE